MPIYEYVCQTCQHAFDVLQRMSDDPVSVTRLVSAAGFQLKGTGWYETDFKTKPPKPDAKKTETTSTKSQKTKGEETS